MALATSAAAQGIALLVPAYFSPSSGFWAQLAASAQRVPLVAIANIYNGPGSDTSARPDYVRALQSVRDAGGQVIGYIYSKYGGRPIATVESDMLKWHQFYPLDGFFVDEMANTPNTALFAYYSNLVVYARSLKTNYVVIANPGTNTEEAYRVKNTADVLTIFEGDASYASFTPAAWTQKYPSYDFAHLVYNIATPDAMKTNLDLATSRRAGFIYITDDTLPNPWDRLPSYWSQEVENVAAVNSAAAHQVLTNLTMARTAPDSAAIRASGAPGVYVLETGFPGQWTAITTNSTWNGSMEWKVTNLSIAPNRLFRTRQP